MEGDGGGDDSMVVVVAGLGYQGPTGDLKPRMATQPWGGGWAGHKPTVQKVRLSSVVDKVGSPGRAVRLPVC